MREAIMPAVRRHFNIKNFSFYTLNLKSMKCESVSKRLRIRQRCGEKSLEPVARYFHTILEIEIFFYLSCPKSQLFLPDHLSGVFATTCELRSVHQDLSIGTRRMPFYSMHASTPDVALQDHVSENQRIP